MPLPRVLSLFFVLCLLFSSCAPRGASTWQDVKSDTWWKDATVYEIFVRSFYDSDGDGVGDFQGLIQKLDYLNDGKPGSKDSLGVNAIWLLPIFPTTTYHGYDVVEYEATNPEYGSMEDFKALVAEAHRRDIKVIIDFVINHTSKEHPWFKASAAKDPQYKNYYIWSEADPGYKGPWGQTVWHKAGDRYYYGVFDAIMPDLNYTHPAVTEEIYRIADFWLKDVGVDGFRLDGAKHLIEQGKTQENTAETRAWLKKFQAHIKEVKPDAFVVGEVWSPIQEASQYIREGSVDMVFNFPLAESMISASTSRLPTRITSMLAQSQDAFPNNQYGAFLSNHDQTRFMTKVGGDLGRAKLAASVLLTGPGTPFLYYGEEIGMIGDKPDPQLRTPMHWSAGAGAGFTTGTPWMAPQKDYAEKNVAAQNENPDALLNHYRALLRIRGEHYALRAGAYLAPRTNERQLFASLRAAEKESVLVLVNFSVKPIEGAKLQWRESTLRGTLQPTLLMGEGQPAPLTVTEEGAVEDFIPLPVIPAGGTVIIQYRP